MNSKPTSFLSAVALSVSFMPAAHATDLVTFQLDWLPSGEHAPIYVCVQQGFCGDADLKVNIEPGRGSSEAITKMATGASDVGIVGLDALMAASANEDVPVTAVMSYFNKGPHSFYSLTETGISSVADLEGKKVVTSPFTSSNVFLPFVLESAGLSKDSIELIESDPGTLAPMVLTGAADVAIAWVTNLSVFEAQAKEADKEFANLPWSTVGLEIYSTALSASDSFLAERPDVAKRFVAAFKQSVEFVQANPEEAAAAVVEMVPEMEQDLMTASIGDTYKLVFNEVTEADGFGVFLDNKLATTWDQVAKSQSIDPEALDPETVVDRSFLTD
ncbi:MAG: ABC transporter substrate-binding protein [Geminicoccaceae bacterium]